MGLMANVHLVQREEALAVVHDGLDHRPGLDDGRPRCDAVDELGGVAGRVAHQDPGLPNWISTVGRPHGTMCLRWIHAKSHPQPRTRVVKLNELMR